MLNIQKISDERLVLKNLKNIRIVYALQAIGIIAVLGYQFVSNGMAGIKESPLWMVFVASTVLLVFLSMKTDERLATKNLQKIRIAYAVQTLGIVGILGYDLATLGRDGMMENPLWIIFILATTILAFLSMNISVDHENNNKSAKKGLVISLVVLVLISMLIGLLTSISEGFSAFDGVLIGGILLICGLVPIIFVFNLRRKREEV